MNTEQWRKGTKGGGGQNYTEENKFKSHYVHHKFPIE